MIQVLAASEYFASKYCELLLKLKGRYFFHLCGIREKKTFKAITEM